MMFPGYPEVPESPFLTSSVQPPSGKVRVLLGNDCESWTTIGDVQFGWPQAYNFFGDGSLYLLDAPGYMIGNLMALARTAEGEFIVMGGDCCHDRLLYAQHGKYDIGTTYGPFPMPCGGASIHRVSVASNKEDQASSDAGNRT